MLVSFSFLRYNQTATIKETETGKRDEGSTDRNPTEVADL